MYVYIKELCSKEKMNIFYGPLQYNYIDYAGDQELLYTICDLQHGNYNFWKSYNTILKFIKHIMTGLNFLHEKKLCHLDVKSENIMVNTYMHQFKIIDFGFSSIEPFDDYVDNIKGTPGYFPKYFSTEKVTPWFPIIQTNDMDFIDGYLPMKKDRKLVYKIDSYCLGRVLYFLKNVYDSNITYCCFRNKKKILDLKIKIDNIISSLIENNVHKRLTINECMRKYFNHS